MSGPLARFLGGPPTRVLARLIVLSLIVGALLIWLDIRPADIFESVGRLFTDLWNTGFGSIREALRYVAVGAVVVVPVWLVLRLLSFRETR